MIATESGVATISATAARAGRRVLTIPADVRDEAQAQRAVKDAVNGYGHLDVLVNNAGVIQVGPLEAMTRADFEEAMDTHF